MPTDAAPITEGTIEANGLTFGYLSAGEGPLALCLHGFPDSAWTWRYLLPELAAAGYHAVAPFIRGYAPTQVPADGMFQTGAHAADAIALHEVLGGDADAVLIGHDVGALALYPAAVHAPERWRRAVALAIAPPGAMATRLLTYDQLKMSWYTFFFQTPFADFVVPMDDHAFIDRIWADWSPGFDGGDFVVRAKACLSDGPNLAAALGWYRATIGSGPRDAAYDVIEAAGGSPLPQPTLYLHGSDDGCFAAADMATTALPYLPAPGSSAEVIDGVGHFLHLEDPEQVNRRVIDFLTV